MSNRSNSLSFLFFSDGLTALHTAAYEGQQAICQLLLAHGSHIDTRDNMEMTALMAATTVGSEELVNILLSNDASVDLLDQDSRTVLSIAASQVKH